MLIIFIRNRAQVPTFDELADMLLGEELLVKRIKEENQSQVIVAMAAQSGCRGHKPNYRGHSPNYRGNNYNNQQSNLHYQPNYYNSNPSLSTSKLSSQSTLPTKLQLKLNLDAIIPALKHRILSELYS